MDGMQTQAMTLRNARRQRHRLLPSPLWGGSRPSKRREKRTASSIDRHAPGNAADRDRDDRLAALGIDDGDVVAEPVGDEELAAVAREREAPCSLADQDVALDLAGRHV